MSKKLKEKLCSCGCQLSRLDVIEVRTGIKGFDESWDPVYTGESSLDYNSQKKAGQDPLYICNGCGKVYDLINPLHEIPSHMAKITSLTDWDQTWVCVICGRTCVHTYDDLVEVGTPGCDCVGDNTDMIRYGVWDGNLQPVDDDDE